MDVQTLAIGVAPVPTPDASADNSATFPVPGAVLPADPSAQGSAQKSLAPDLHLPQAVAKLFSGGSSSAVTVSFQVAHNPNEIVTVFKNSATGAVISQVPSEIMIKMAEFFDQVVGALLDKSA